MVSVRLRDTSGHLFTCAFYHLPYRSINGQLHHLIGIQEESDDRRPSRADGRLPGRCTQLVAQEAVLQQGVAQALRAKEECSTGDGSAGAAPGGEDESQGGGSIHRQDSQGSSRSGSARDAEWSGTIVVHAEEGLRVIVADAAAREKLGLEKGDAFAVLLDAGAGRGEFEGKVIRIAQEVDRAGVAAIGSDLGVWDITPQKSDGDGRFHRCQIFSDYRPASENCGTMMAKLRLASAPRTADGWRIRMGPLQASRRRASGQAPPVEADRAVMELEPQAGPCATVADYRPSSEHSGILVAKPRLASEPRTADGWHMRMGPL
eukprot:CAMPEP_0170308324 /NCGR_PEP_ID=MMETSP0116_2-20130129/54600_1 /TAXON_ID=400756 /ORGANISM="Durinskia baltica, Strain CSIRO CS-38" /LENGTH=318 /DNA_ID=CAMNT_0010560503 /DNA_START=24 /DNA_END=981 /DNA_ORIENTATION=-